jgi:sugar phosphate isomerase/epimerase
MLSCSTCWNSDRHTDGRVMIREILDLGFENIELGHGIRLSLMEGIQKLFARGKFTVSSLHNFCPLPIEITRSSPDCYEFSSPRPSERERAVKLSLQTIDFAVRLNAPLVVMHLGRVLMKEATDSLIALAKDGKQFSREYVQCKLEAVRTREERAPVHLQRVKDCLARIVGYAGEKGIKLGFEGRYAFEEIPNEREALELFAELNAPHVGYWHDFGHIQVKHNLGFLDHHDWLSRFGPRLLGAHLHDCVWPDGDHRAPFTGGIDYDRLVPLLPDPCLFVFEMSPRRTKEEIITAREKWQTRFGS